MSQLPDVDASKTAQRLSIKLAEVQLQLSHLEILAEALRDERDAANDLNSKLTQELSALKDPTD